MTKITNYQLLIQILMHHLRLTIDSRYTVGKITSIINETNPGFIVLESQSSLFNTKTINYANNLIQNGWKEVKIKTRKPKHGDVITIMLTRR